MAIGCGSGLYFLHWETNIVRLWNPENSESGINFKWLWINHPPDLRRHSILFQAENILNKENLKKVFKFKLWNILRDLMNFKIYVRSQLIYSKIRYTYLSFRWFSYEKISIQLQHPMDIHGIMFV